MFKKKTEKKKNPKLENLQCGVLLWNFLITEGIT